MNQTADAAEAGSESGYARLYYLDWLRLIAILMVFLFHAVHPFDLADWQVKNVEQSEILSIFLTLLSLWGMPFFFLVAGAGSWFALRKRSPRQYIRERFNRLIIPFFVGTILFSPLELYMEWANHIWRGVWDVAFWQYVFRPPPAGNLLAIISPRWFGYGFHLWFLAFLFFFALITLPLFLWFKDERGRRVISWLAGICEHRGGLLIFIVPLGLISSLLKPTFPEQHDWADFIYQMSFFALGFVLFADPLFRQSIRRDWLIFLGVPTALVVGLVGMYLAGFPVIEWGESPETFQFHILQFVVSAVALCYSLTMIFVGMQFLDFTNKWLVYGLEAALPFFVVHQPVIIAIAFFVVQWQVGIGVKLPVVVISSFVVSLALVEVIRRIRPLRPLFGMKTPTAGPQPVVITLGGES